jgi:hypothetical protein
MAIFPEDGAGKEKAYLTYLGWFFSERIELPEHKALGSQLIESYPLLRGALEEYCSSHSMSLRPDMWGSSEHPRFGYNLVDGRDTYAYSVEFICHRSNDIKFLAEYEHALCTGFPNENPRISLFVTCRTDFSPLELVALLKEKFPQIPLNK